MKRSNHIEKRGTKPVIECRWCGHHSPSKYEAKNHVCRETSPSGAISGPLERFS